MNYEFKELTDLCAIEKTYGIYRHCMYQPTPEKFSRKMNGFLEDVGSKIFACYHSGVLCGVMVLSFLAPDKAEIAGIATDPAARGSGVGTYMVNAAISQYHLHMLVAETDDDAVGFYRKSGFSITAFTETYDGEAVVRYNCKYTK